MTGESCLGALKVNETDDRWRDDVWTMKYLSGFKWEMLGEQVGMSSLGFSLNPYEALGISMRKRLINSIRKTSTPSTTQE